MESAGKEQSNKKQLIIDAATRLILEQGVKGTSLADVAREAQISKGTLFYYFPAKDDLIYELTVQHFDKLTHALLDRIETMKSEPVYKIIKECIGTILMAEDRGRLNLYLLQEAVTENEALRLRFRQTYEDYRVLNKRFLQVAYPSCSADDTTVLSTLLIALLDGLIIQWLIDPNAVPIERVSRIMANLHFIDPLEI